MDSSSFLGTPCIIKSRSESFGLSPKMEDRDEVEGHYEDGRKAGLSFR
jgi:hypothetical protein